MDVAKKMKQKVLIVDDDSDLLEMLSEILISAGFKVVTATDGVDGSFKYNNETFDIILTDIKMPKKDGIKFVKFIQETEAQKAIKNGPTFKQTPIILISASADEYRVELEVLGNIEILNKPFSPKEVMEKVERLIDKKVVPSNGNGNIMSFKAGNYVIKEGDTGTDIYFVKEGTLKITKKGPNNEEITITTIKAGEMVGEMGFLLHKHRTASVLAVTDSMLISIPKEKFEAVLATQPRWFKVLFETISTRLEDTTKLLIQERLKH